MNSQKQDRIVTLMSVGEMGGMQAVEPQAFLNLFPDSWKELIASGISFYIDALGHALAPDEALRRLQPELQPVRQTVYLPFAA